VENVDALRNLTGDKRLDAFPTNDLDFRVGVSGTAVAPLFYKFDDVKPLDNAFMRLQVYIFTGWILYPFMALADITPAKTPLVPFVNPGTARNFSLRLFQVSPVKPDSGSDAEPQLNSSSSGEGSNLKPGILSPVPNGVGGVGNKQPSYSLGSKTANQPPSSGDGNKAGQNQQPQGAERKLPSQSGGDSGGGSSQAQSFGLWWPVCLLIDSNAPDANKQVAEMVKMSADCGVNLQPYIRQVVIQDPNNDEQINQLQSQTCNLKQAGIAEKGSTLVITNRSSTVADKMCASYEGNPPKLTQNVAGCNEIAQGISGNAEKLLKGEGQGQEKKIAGSSVAVGIVDLEGFDNGKIWSHEAIGHGQMGWPNGKGAGNGIANGDDPQDNGGEDPQSEGKQAYTPIGCTRMRAQAIPDPKHYHSYYPDKQRYYSVNQAGLLHPLGEPIWQNSPDKPQNPDQNLTKNTPTLPRTADAPNGDSNSAAGESSTSTDPIHKKMAQQSKGSQGTQGGGRGSSVRKGNEVGNTADRTASVPNRGQMGSGEADAGSSKPLAPPAGPGDAKESIVADRSKSALATSENGGANSGSVMNPNYLADGNGGAGNSPNKESVASQSNESGSGGSKTSLEKGNQPKNSLGPELASDFFNDSVKKGPDPKNPPIRKSLPVDQTASVNQAPKRTPASPTTERLPKKQVEYDSM
jgi:hypothetical protein